jgi:hypothetical protein
VGWREAGTPPPCGVRIGTAGTPTTVAVTAAPRTAPWPRTAVRAAGRATAAMGGVGWSVQCVCATSVPAHAGIGGRDARAQVLALARH